MRRIAMALGLAGGFLLLLVLALQTRAAPAMPMGRHCGDPGPLTDDLEYCGCTWGEVYFHGRPVPGAAITLTFNGEVETDVTRCMEEEAEPYFGLTAHDLGARRGDVLTLTARFARQTVERAFRAWPEADWEQHVVLAFPERGVWSPWVTGGTTRALALNGDVVWAGGPAGVISVSLSTGVSVVHTLPWTDPFVRALAVVTDGHVWAAGTGGVAEFDGSVWHTHTIPLDHALQALAVDSTTGAVWVGEEDYWADQGSAAVYNGTWQMTGTFSAPVTALAVDDEGRAWAATRGAGVYRQDGRGGWTRHQEAEGLASKYVLAAVAGGGAVWFGTKPYGNGGAHGGIVRYDLANGTWQVYTTAHGLPADTLLPQAPAPVYALAMGEDNIPWAGTAAGVWFPASEDWWAGYTTTHGLRPGAVMALVVGGGTAVAATPAGLDRLDPAATSGAPPVAQITDVSPLTLTAGAMLTLNGGGWDGDEGGSRVVAWDWSSSLDGPVCTSDTCTLPHSLFAPGAHVIALKVQDDEGMWSEPVLETVVVKEPERVFLPLVVSQCQGE